MSELLSIAAQRNLRARERAQIAVEGVVSAPANTVQYQSRGRVLVIGGEQALLFAPRLLPTLKPEVLVTDGSDEASVPAIHLGLRKLDIAGHLGDFEVALGEAGERDHEIIRCDLVVDLSPQAQLDIPLPPPGYFHADPDAPLALDALAIELVEMVGRFEKPRFFSYDENRCAHGRNGIEGCTRCIDACPALAIRSLGEQIEVDPFLCQGGGACATACPSGAIEYALPSPIDLQERVRRLLQIYQQEEGEQPMLAFLAGDACGVPSGDAPHVLWVSVEEVASVGLEVWLAALAQGAAAVRLVHQEPLPLPSAQLLQEQLAIAATLLDSWGYPTDAIACVDAAQFDAEAMPDWNQPLPPARFAALGTKRQRLFMAIDHLHQQAAAQPEVIAFDRGAPFGQVEVDDTRCTLCMACTSGCPSGALIAGGEIPRLRFIEANCVQCDICEKTCPEQAISITPRLLLDEAARKQPRTLYEEQPFCCVQCGKPFATRRVIETVLGRLGGNPMFQSERARRRLQMCEDCRVIDIAQDDEAMQGNLFKGGSHAA